MKKIVVIGGGTMGLDIAQLFAGKGFDVVVRDINDDIIKASEARLNKGLDKLVSKGKMEEAGKKAITDKMTFTTNMSLAADADLVIEAVIEKLEIKKSIFAELDRICKPETILARETVSSMQAGLVYGYIGQTEYIISQMKKESGYTDARVVATGGLGNILAAATESIDIYDPILTLEGLRLVYERNRLRSRRPDGRKDA